VDNVYFYTSENYHPPQNLTHGCRHSPALRERPLQYLGKNTKILESIQLEVIDSRLFERFTGVVVAGKKYSKTMLLFTS
jgi:hypothetical protein